MPAQNTPPVLLVFGEDDFAVKQAARHQFDAWCQAAGGEDHEIVDGQVGNAAEALQSIGRLREAVQTLPFFGGEKVVWWRACTFFGDDRTASSQAVTEALSELAQSFKSFNWSGVRLLISAGKVDKRKVFYKTVEKLGETKTFAAWGPDSKNWPAEAEGLALQTLRQKNVAISDEALASLVEAVGPNRPQLLQELEKLSLFLGDRKEITVPDVNSIVTRNKQARAFALADALGERKLTLLLKTLDEELWEVKLDRQRSEIGLLYGLISKVRMLILAKELLREKLLQPVHSFSKFRSLLAQIPQDRLPEDRRFNPLSMSPYPLFRATQQAGNYSLEELVDAMQRLLECNQRLIFSSLDSGIVLQQTLLQIVARPEPGRAGTRR